MHFFVLNLDILQIFVFILQIFVFISGFFMVCSSFFMIWTEKIAKRRRFWELCSQNHVFLHNSWPIVSSTKPNRKQNVRGPTPSLKSSSRTPSSKAPSKNNWQYTNIFLFNLWCEMDLVEKKIVKQSPRQLQLYTCDRGDVSCLSSSTVLSTCILLIGGII